jgi:hypothetical protein
VAVHIVAYYYCSLKAVSYFHHKCVKNIAGLCKQCV